MWNHHCVLPFQHELPTKKAHLSPEAVQERIAHEKAFVDQRLHPRGKCRRAALCHQQCGVAALFAFALGLGGKTNQLNSKLSEDASPFIVRMCSQRVRHGFKWRPQPSRALPTQADPSARKARSNAARWICWRTPRGHQASWRRPSTRRRVVVRESGRQIRCRCPGRTSHPATSTHQRMTCRH